MIDVLSTIQSWSNENAGFLAIILFVLTFLGAWASGILRGLRRKPNVKLNILEDGPTFFSTLFTGRDVNGHKTHRTAIVLYLGARNVGTVPCTIEQVWCGYRTKNLRCRVFRHWLRATLALRDFSEKIGEEVRVFPFFMQRNLLLPDSPDLYLEVGKHVGGVVYFEQQESWGDFVPRESRGYGRMKVWILDSFGRSYSKCLRVRKLPIEQAVEYNAEFGMTHERRRFSTKPMSQEQEANSQPDTPACDSGP